MYLRLIAIASIMAVVAQPNTKKVNDTGGTAYYVATNGSDTAAGTMAAPWQTLQHAAASVRAGDTVRVRGGVYHEAVRIAVSGSNEMGPITFESAPGELATLDGTGVAVHDGQSGLLDIADQSYLTIRGFEIRNFTSSTDANVPIGIYVHGAGTHLQILANHVHHITTTAPANAVNCASNALGIAVYGTRAPDGIEQLTISGNEVDHLKTGCSETVTLNGNVSHFLVSHNLIHDNDNIGIDAIGFERKSPTVEFDQARDGVITDNTVYNISSYGNPDYGNVYSANGIYVDGGTRILIEHNTVHNTDINVELASEHSGRLTSYITLRDNVIYDGNANGISIGGYDAKRGGTEHCIITQNVLRNNDTKNTGGGEFQIQFYAADNIFENNEVFVGTGQKVVLHSYTEQARSPAALDANDYIFRNPKDATWLWNGKTYTTFSSYRAVSGQDAHSTYTTSN